MQYDPDALVSEDQGRLGPGESAPDDVDLTLHRAVAIRERPRWQAQPPARLLQALRPHSRCLGLARLRPRFGHFPAVPASLVRTSDERAVALRVLLQEVRRPALRAAARDGPIPGGELAVRVVHAAEEALAEARFALGQAAAAVGADDALERDGPGGLAGRVVRAREETADPAPLDHHRAAALFADEIGGLLLALDVAHLRFRCDQALLEGLVELAEHRLPLDLAFFDLVQLLLHPRGELHVHHARE